MANKKKLNPKIVADIIEKSQEYIELAIKYDLLPFASATKTTGGTYTYDISPKMFDEYLVYTKSLDEDLGTGPLPQKPFNYRNYEDIPMYLLIPTN